MANLSVNFTIPWLLLLLIPAVIFTLIPYFKLSKRYRRTRNRIISIALHLMIMLMCISVLSGITFAYDIPNKDNAIILLVDVSYSNLENEDVKDEYVRDAIEQNHGLYNMGIVAFGYNSYPVSEPTYDTDRLLESYQSFRDKQKQEREMLANNIAVTKIVDDTATDVSAALRYAADMFDNKVGSKIVVISDGIQTDGDAITTVRQLASEGIKVDAVTFANTEKLDTEILDVLMPEYAIRVNEEFTMMLSVRSSIAADRAQLTITDLNTGLEEVRTTRIIHGLQQIDVPYKFLDLEMHTLKFDISVQGDTEENNNTYYTYVYLENYDRVLILEGFKGESDTLKSLLDEDFKVESININPQNGEFDKVPQTVEKLRDYDQIILFNVSNSDLINGALPGEDGTKVAMPLGFDKMLEEYVNVHGGGLFVVGGNESKLDGETTAHAFNWDDMGAPEAKVFSDMLPVEVVEYTPPIGVVIIIDRSPSMQNTINGQTRLYFAKQAAEDCLSAMSSYRDYVGIMTLESTYSVNVNMISTRYNSTIRSAIQGIEIAGSGGTVYAGALQRAAESLSGLSDAQVAKRHIILISDGEPGDAMRNNGSGYGDVIESFYKSAGITFTIVNNGGTNPKIGELGEALKWEGCSFINLAPEEIGRGGLSTAMQALFKTDAISQYDPDQVYIPQISNHSSPIVKGIDEKYLPKMSGFYGTREKDSVDVQTILRADYVPLYTQWQYGLGMVGAYMSTLDGNESPGGAIGSSALLKDPNGRMLITNIVRALMPSKNIRYNDIIVSMDEDNYRTRLNITTSIKETEKIKVTVTQVDSNRNPNAQPQVVYPSAEDGYGRVSVEIKTPGLHEIYIQKVSVSDEEEISSLRVYKTFSYSKEYDVFVDDATIGEFMGSLASGGNGEVLDPYFYDSDGKAHLAAEYIFTSFKTVIHKEYDPRMLFIILSIIFFLLDVAVRKFKFKWPHEIVRDYRLRKELNNKN